MRVALLTIELSYASPACKSPTVGPSAVGCGPETSRVRPSVRIRCTTRWLGADTCDTFTSGRTIRLPAASTVQTMSPTLRLVTATSPIGVAMREAEERHLQSIGEQLST